MLCCFLVFVLLILVFCYSSDVRTRTRETVKQNNKKKSFSRAQHSHTTTDTAGGFQSTLVVAGTTRPTPPPADRPQRPPQCRRFPSLVQFFSSLWFFLKLLVLFLNEEKNPEIAELSSRRPERATHFQWDLITNFISLIRSFHNVLTWIDERMSHPPLDKLNHITGHVMCPFKTIVEIFPITSIAWDYHFVLNYFWSAAVIGTCFELEMSLIQQRSTS